MQLFIQWPEGAPVENENRCFLSTREYVFVYIAFSIELKNIDGVILNKILIVMNLIYLFIPQVLNFLNIYSIGTSSSDLSLVRIII